MKRIRIAEMLLGAVLFASPAGIAAPPAELALELSQLRILRSFPTVSAMPQQLRRALTRTFELPRLELADPGTRYKEISSLDYPGNPEAGLPDRRLLFAFETPRYYFVYYEAGHPWHAAALAFSKPSPVRLVWGGADLNRPYANSPAKLQARILRHKLLDDQKFIW